MKNAIYHFLISSIFFLVFLSCGTGADKKNERKINNADISARIDSIAESYLNQGKTVGFSIAVLQDNKPLYAKGFGYSNLDNKTPVTEKTIPTTMVPRTAIRPSHFQMPSLMKNDCHCAPFFRSTFDALCHHGSYIISYAHAERILVEGSPHF